MTTLHPHWESDDEQEVLDRVDGIVPAASADSMIHLQTKTVSRKPAAMVGIALVLFAGVGLFQGFGFFTAQLGPSTLLVPVEIRITDDGIEPASAEVRPGQEVIFYNDQADLPHILESNSIKDFNDKPLYTPAIFPGTSQSFKLSLTHPVGTFQYVSTTASDVVGRLIVKADISTVFTSSNRSSIAAAVLSSISSVSSTPVFAGQTSSDSSAGSAQADGIPTNPYTVGSNRQHTFDSNGNPITGTQTSSARSQQTLRPAAPTPPRQPSSGPEVWVVAILSVVSLFVMTRKTAAVHS